MSAVVRTVTAFVAERLVEFLLITAAVTALMGGQGLQMALRLVGSYYLLSGYPLGALLAWIARRRLAVHWQAMLACLAFLVHLAIFLVTRGLLTSPAALGMAGFLGVPALAAVAFCAVLGARLRKHGPIPFTG